MLFSPFCANSNPFTSSSSLISEPPASIIFIFKSDETETTKSAIHASRSRKLGFKTHFESLHPIRNAAIGPFQGISEISSVIDEAIMATTSGSFFSSTERTVATI